MSLIGSRVFFFYTHPYVITRKIRTYLNQRHVYIINVFSVKPSFFHPLSSTPKLSAGTVYAIYVPCITV